MVAIVAVLAEIHVFGGAMPDGHIILAFLANDVFELFLMFLVESKVNHIARQDLLLLEESELVLVDFLLCFFLEVNRVESRWALVVLAVEVVLEDWVASPGTDFYYEEFVFSFFFGVDVDLSHREFHP